MTKLADYRPAARLALDDIIKMACVAMCARDHGLLRTDTPVATPVATNESLPSSANCRWIGSGADPVETPWMPIREHLRALSPEALRETYREVDAYGQSVNAAKLLLHTLTRKYFATKSETWSSQSLLDAGRSFLHAACIRECVINNGSIRVRLTWPFELLRRWRH